MIIFVQCIGFRLFGVLARLLAIRLSLLTELIRPVADVVDLNLVR